MATYLRKTGAVRSDASEILTVDGDGVGFPPKRIELVNETAATTLLWYESMGQDHCLVRNAAGASTMHTSGGITTNYTGFLIPAGLVDINDTDGELLSYIVTG